MLWTLDIPLTTKIRHRLIKKLAKNDSIAFNVSFSIHDSTNISSCYLYDSPINIIGDCTTITANLIKMKRSKAYAIKVKGTK
jgi:hypothetical protein